MRYAPILLSLLTLACSGEAAPPTTASPQPAVNSTEPAPEPVAQEEPAAEPVAQAEPAAEPIAQEEPAAEPIAQAEPAAEPPGPRSCAQIEEEYRRLTSRDSCRTDADCHMVPGQCALGLGGCSHAVNVSVSAAALAELGPAHRAAGCGTRVCRCARMAEAASCVAGHCEPRRPAPPTTSPPTTSPGAPGSPGQTSPPHRCPALACALPPDCVERIRDANGCPTCRCTRP